MGDVYILAVARTPFGLERGALATVEPYRLAATVIERLAQRLPTRSFDCVLLANVTNTAGNVARVAALAAGLPATTPAMTINSQCTGGLTSIRLATEMIQAGSAQAIVAGGTESVSQAAVALEGLAVRRGGTPAERPTIAHAPPGWPDPVMGAAADALARRLGLTRAALDEYAGLSFRRAAAAHAAGFFDPLLVPVSRPDGTQLATDERARRVPRPESLARLSPAFTPEGPTTAGNCAPVADGAAAVALASAAAIAAGGYRPLARVVATASVAGSPADPAGAVLPAIECALARAERTPAEIDRWEINEAFAVKVLACQQHFGLELDRLNVHGGAIAYGHPFAASGAALVVHLVAELQQQKARFGVAALAGAGGLGEALVLERAG